MRYIGIVLVLGSFPAFYYALGTNANWRRWLIVALGAAPIMNSGLNLDAALISWAGWPGHTKGLLISLTDTLALATCLRFYKRARKPMFLWLWLFYTICSLPGLFVGDLFTPAFFYTVSLCKAALYFSACYIVFLRFGPTDFINGLALAIIANGVATVWNSLQGQVQAAGMIGHRNYAGMICNMAVPVLLVVGMQTRLKALPLIAVLMSALAAALGGSRAVIILFGVTVFSTLLLAMLIKPSKQVKIVLSVSLLASVVVAPLAIHTLSNRFEQTGGDFTLEKDSEREAFERAARMMNEDHPLGVGSNQYAVTANSGGYSAAAGINWVTISNSATVHNSYVLIRSEGGQIALLGMLVLLTLPLIMALIYLCRRRLNPARLLAVPVFVATSVLILHIRFEWAFVAMTSLYLYAFNTALFAYVWEASQQARRQKTTERYAAARQVSSASPVPSR